MTQLYSDSRGSEELALSESQTVAIGARLAEIGVHYEHIELPAVRFDPEAETDEVIQDYLGPLNAIEKIMPYESLELLRINPEHRHFGALQHEFMTEHAHGSAEAQLLVNGGGTLYIRTQDEVLALVCDPGDFVRLPPRLCHWFGMDCKRGVCTIRLFEPGADLTPIRRGRNMRAVYSLPDDGAVDHRNRAM